MLRHGVLLRVTTVRHTPGAQACFLTVKSTATPLRMHCGTHWRAFWPKKARLCPPYKGVFFRIIDKNDFRFFSESVWNFAPG